MECTTPQTQTVTADGPKDKSKQVRIVSPRPDLEKHAPDENAQRPEPKAGGRGRGKRVRGLIKEKVRCQVHHSKHRRSIITHCAELTENTGCPIFVIIGPPRCSKSNIHKAFACHEYSALLRNKKLLDKQSSLFAKAEQSYKESAKARTEFMQSSSSPSTSPSSSSSSSSSSTAESAQNEPSSTTIENTQTVVDLDQDMFVRKQPSRLNSTMMLLSESESDPDN